jgi:undecaprenyl-phosphate galactose phosphotransferase
MHSDTTIALEYGKLNINYKKSLYFTLKRIFDILCGIFGIIVMIPLAFIIKIVYMLNGDFKSIFFKQKRLGKDGKIMYIYKFRTMVPNAEEILQEWLKNNEDKRDEYLKTRKIDNDPRITKVGKILRETSLDEFPQFINVLKGDMAMIGPRPVVVDEADNYGKNKAKFLSVRPGLTGYWAANGRSNTTYKQRIKMELFYVDNCSAKLDIQIIFETIKSVLKKEGAK